MGDIFSLIEGIQGEKGLCLVALHGDEIVAKEVCRRAQKLLGCGAVIFEGEKRLVQFSFQNRNFVFDPNRIWTPQRIDNFAEIDIDAYCDFRRKIYWPIREHLDSFSAVVALHNNGKTDFSMNSFVGGSLKSGCQKYFFANPPKDKGDFFLVTLNEIFRALSEKNFNVVLQNKFAPHDGSLSFWLKSRPFINIETRLRENNAKETFELQIQMLAAALRALRLAGRI